MHQRRRRDIARLAIAAKRADIGHAVARLKFLDALADGDHLARPFMAGHERKLGRISAGAPVNIDVIHANGVVA